MPSRLFGFHILDPLPAARRRHSSRCAKAWSSWTLRGRVVSLNPAGSQKLKTSAAHANGKSLGELLPALSDLAALLSDAPRRAH